MSIREGRTRPEDNPHLYDPITKTRMDARDNAPDLLCRRAVDVFGRMRFVPTLRTRGRYV